MPPRQVIAIAEGYPAQNPTRLDAGFAEGFAKKRIRRAICAIVVQNGWDWHMAGLQGHRFAIIVVEHESGGTRSAIRPP
jgi:hypothetical protein